MERIFIIQGYLTLLINHMNDKKKREKYMNHVCEVMTLVIILNSNIYYLDLKKNFFT